jgi:DNA polymerase-3 subunit gamma/tau
MAFQSLYRRFRPQRFGEVIGQDHVITALRNAVVQDRVGHAYLLSGPRGTGKTTTARILAKALNCEDLGADGEPCGECGSCVAIERGVSMDLFELDAASNNGVDQIRELNQSAALGTPGRRKVYLLDEVHMLTKQGSAALLKTLEEPPDHVVFVLATTDPKRVQDTIRSRTQQFELNLIGAEMLAAHVREIAERADIEVDDATLDYVVHEGQGSVRDALSTLDRVVAAGGVVHQRIELDAVLDGLAEGDTAASLGAVAALCAAGVDARELAEQLARRLRDAFLVLMDVDPGQFPEGVTGDLAEYGRRLGPAATVRALELIGTALVDMRQAPDPRLTLEVALVRLTAPQTDTSLASLAQRVERLERGAGAAPSPARAAKEALAGAAPPVAEEATKPPPPPPPPSPPPPPVAEAASPAPATEAESTTPAAPSAVSRDQLTMDWEHIRAKLPNKARARFEGRWVSVDGGIAVYALPNEPHRQRCEEIRGDVEATIAAFYGVSLTLRLVAEADSASPPSADPRPDDDVPVEATVPASGPPVDSITRLTDAFPGAVVIGEDGRDVR